MKMSCSLRVSVLAALMVCYLRGDDHHDTPTSSEILCYSYYIYSFSCPRGSFVAVQSAEYGRRREDVRCETTREATTYNGDCRQEFIPVTDRMQVRCFWRGSCLFRVSDEVFRVAEPCRNRGNYLNMTIFCIQEKQFTTVCGGTGEIINDDKGYIASKDFPDDMPSQKCRILFRSLTGKTRLYLRLLYVSPQYMAYCGSTLVFSSTQRVSLNGAACRGETPPTSLNLTLPVVLEMGQVWSRDIARGFFLYFEMLDPDESLSPTVSFQADSGLTPNIQGIAPTLQGPSLVTATRDMVESITFELASETSTAPERQKNNALGKDKKAVIGVVAAVLIVVIITLAVVIFVILKAWKRVKSSSKTSEAVVNLTSRPSVADNQYGTSRGVAIETPPEGAPHDVTMTSTMEPVGRLPGHGSIDDVDAPRPPAAPTVTMSEARVDIAPPSTVVVSANARATREHEPNASPSDNSEGLYYNTLPTLQNMKIRSDIGEGEDDDYDDDFESLPDLTAIRPSRTRGPTTLGLPHLTGPAMLADERRMEENELYDL